MSTSQALASSKGREGGKGEKEGGREERGRGREGGRKGRREVE